MTIRVSSASGMTPTEKAHVLYEAQCLPKLIWLKGVKGTDTNRLLGRRTKCGRQVGVHSCEAFESQD